MSNSADPNGKRWHVWRTVEGYLGFGTRDDMRADFERQMTIYGKEAVMASQLEEVMTDGYIHTRGGARYPASTQDLNVARREQSRAGLAGASGTSDANIARREAEREHEERYTTAAAAISSIHAERQFQNSLNYPGDRLSPPINADKPFARIAAASDDVFQLVARLEAIVERFVGPLYEEATAGAEILKTPEGVLNEVSDLAGRVSDAAARGQRLLSHLEKSLP